METKTIKVSSDTYKDICEFAGELQKELREPISIDKALTFLFHKKKLSDLAGSWKMSDKEAEEMFSEAFNIYSMFWAINGISINTEKVSEGKLSKISQLMKKVLDCCKE